VPTYEYACRQCGTHLDVVQKFSDESLTTCPSCSGSLRKVFGSIGISFKGSGFYKNDSRSSDNGAKKGENGEKGEKGEKEPAAKADSSAKTGDGTSSTSSESSTTKSAPAKSDAPKAGAPKAAS